MQGDSWSALCFALATIVICKGLTNHLGVQVWGYLDDFVLLCRTGELEKIRGILQAMLGELGLELENAKSQQLILGDGIPQGAVDPQIQQVSELEVLGSDINEGKFTWEAKDAGPPSLKPIAAAIKGANVT